MNERGPLGMARPLPRWQRGTPFKTTIRGCQRLDSVVFLPLHHWRRDQ